MSANVFERMAEAMDRSLSVLAVMSDTLDRIAANVDPPVSCADEKLAAVREYAEGLPDEAGIVRRDLLAIIDAECP